MSMRTPSLLAVLMMQFWTYFWRFRQCQLNFMPFASALHAAVAFSRATLSALDIFAASVGVGTNAMPLTSTVAIMPAIKAVAKWYMIPSLELLLFTPRPSYHIAMVGENRMPSQACSPKHCSSMAGGQGHGHVRPRAAGRPRLECSRGCLSHAMSRTSHRFLQGRTFVSTSSSQLSLQIL